MKNIWEFIKVVPAIVEFLVSSHYDELAAKLKNKFSKKTK